MRKSIIVLIILLNIQIFGKKTELLAQPSFSMDTTFQPFFDLRPQPRGGPTYDLWENPSNGNLHIAGDFRYFIGNDPYYSILSTHRDGSRNFNYLGFGGSGYTFIYPFNDSVLILGTGWGGGNSPMALKGNPIWTNWFQNYRQTVSCSHAYWPYFFLNGSSLMTNSWFGNPNVCLIKNPPDTFPSQAIIKVDSLGLFDSTFQHTANGTVDGFKQYDSNRLLTFGLPRKFTEYDGQTVNGICRIYMDGTLDTTFKSPVLPGNGGFVPELIEPNGKIFIVGRFQLVDYPNRWFSMCRLNANGSIDTTFNNLGSPIDTNYVDGAGIGSVIKTPDNGYLVGGLFNQVQGVARNGIVKLDSLGNIEPQYFTSRGPDSTHVWKNQGYVNKIVESKFGGYYVLGDWTYWDGVPAQPIIRLHEMQVVGLKEQQQSGALLKVYPNPVQEQLYLEYLPNVRVSSIELYDLQGKVVQSVNQKVNSIAVNGLKTGIYFLKVISENGVSTEKVVVAK